MFGTRLKELRLGLGLTLDTVSKQVGVSKGYLSEIENEKRTPPSDQVVAKLAEVLQHPPDRLLRLAHIDRLPSDIREPLERLRFWPLLEADSSLASTARDVGAGCSPPGADVPILNQEDEPYQVEFGSIEAHHPTSSWGSLRPPGIGDPDAFAITVNDASMMTTASPSFTKGSVIIISPSRLARSGDLVYAIVSTGARDQAIFRQLFHDPQDQIRLQPLNLSFPPLMIPATQLRHSFPAVGRFDSLL